LVNGNCWANIATIDIVYDVLHLMGRNDISVCLVNTTAFQDPILGCTNSYATKNVVVDASTTQVTPRKDSLGHSRIFSSMFGSHATDFSSGSLLQEGEEEMEVLCIITGKEEK
jgi:hypothetical protein